VARVPCLRHSSGNRAIEGQCPVERGAQAQRRSRQECTHRGAPISTAAQPCHQNVQARLQPARKRPGHCFAKTSLQLGCGEQHGGQSQRFGPQCAEGALPLVLLKLLMLPLQTVSRDRSHGRSVANLAKATGPTAPLLQSLHENYCQHGRC